MTNSNRLLTFCRQSSTVMRDMIGSPRVSVGIFNQILGKESTLSRHSKVTWELAREPKMKIGRYLRFRLEKTGDSERQLNAEKF